MDCVMKEIGRKITEDDCSRDSAEKGRKASARSSGKDWQGGGVLMVRTTPNEGAKFEFCGCASPRGRVSERAVKQNY